MPDLKSKPMTPPSEPTKVPSPGPGPSAKGETGAGGIVSFLKTLGWVAPLTILIWIYAEREQSATKSSVQVSIEVRLQEPNRLVRLTDPPEPDHNLLLELAGPRTNLDRVIREITSGTADHPRIHLVIPPRQPRGEHGLSALELVAADPIFTNNGISVKSVSPTQISVFIDDIEERDLPVQAPPGMSNIVEVPIFSPSLVKVRAPRTTFENAEKEGKLRLIADLSRVEAAKQPGRHDVPSVPLTWEFQKFGAELSTPTVRASFEVKLAEEEWVIPSLPVFIVIPGTLQDRYRVDYSTTIANVKVAGPAEIIAKLKAESVSAGALLYIDPQNLRTGQEIKGTLKFDQPEGVHFVDEADKRISYKLVDRSTAP